jgi:ketosteroid isomerase-like protein
LENKLRKSAAASAQDSSASSQEELSDAALAASPELEEFYQKLQPEMRRPKPGPKEMAAALEAVQRLAVEAGAEDAAADITQKLAGEASAPACPVCGYRNREGNKFCGMCGQSVEAGEEDSAGEESHAVNPPVPFALPRLPRVEPRPIPPMGTSAKPAPGVSESHHFHHHYHYFPSGQEGMMPRSLASADSPRETERVRPAASPLRGESMSRAEAAVRRATSEWTVACNTKHLDDLLDLYTADATVMRSNYPAVRGAAAIRELFFNALDSGLGEVELDPIRVDVVGDFAYEAGSCKALVPGATGKRREERGKYLWVLTRQGNGEWKVAADCWSSDLTLPSAEFVAPVPAPKPVVPPRKP